MNINDFTSKFTGQGARNSLFEVLISSPSLASDTSFMVKASAIPKSEVGEAVASYMGRKTYKPGDRTFSDWTVELYNDEGFVLRNQFELWSNSINGHQSNITSDPTYKNSMAKIIQYSTSGAVLQTYTVYNLWPKEVGEIQLKWDDNDKIETYEVVFALDWWDWDV